MYIGSCAGIFFALDKHSGDVVWSYDVKQDGDQMSFHGEMLVTGETVLIGTDTSIGHVYAFDKDRGEVRWKHRVRGEGASTDILQNGSRVYTVTRDDELICLDIDTGAQLWAFASDSTAREVGWSPPAALCEDRILFGGRDGVVCALGLDDGGVIWTRDVGARVSAAPVVVGDTGYLGAANNAFYRLSVDDGTMLHSIDLPAVPIGKPTLTRDAIFVLVSSDPLTSTSELLVGLDPLLEKELWRRSSDEVWSAMKTRVWNGVLLTGKRGGEVAAYRLDDGEPAWSFHVEGDVRSIGADENMLYVGTIDGMLYAVYPGN